MLGSTVVVVALAGVAGCDAVGLLGSTVVVVGLDGVGGVFVVVVLLLSTGPFFG